MPIITTLVIGARPCIDPRRRDAVGKQRAVGVPELADDLAGRQVAVEALLAGRAERAVERAAGLRRDAQRAAVVFRDVDGLDRVAAADVEQPLACAVARPCCRERPAARRCSASAARRSRNALAEVAHRLDVVREPLVDPARHLARAKRLLAAFGEETPPGPAGSRSRRFVIGDARRRTLPSARVDVARAGRSTRSRLSRSPAASEPCTALASIDCAKSARIVPGAAFFGSVAPISSRFLAIALSPSSTWTITGPVVMKSTRSRKNGRSRWTA